MSLEKFVKISMLIVISMICLVVRSLVLFFGFQLYSFLKYRYDHIHF